MVEINQYSPVWASGSGAKKPLLEDAKIESGFVNNDLSYLEYYNFFYNLTQKKLNEIIINYWNLSEDNLLGVKMTLEDDIGLCFGSSSDAEIVYTTANPSNHQLQIGVPATNKTLSICEQADINKTFSITNLAYPVLRLHGASETNWIELYHDGTDAVVNSDIPIRLYPGSSTTPVAIGAVTASSHALNSRNDVIVEGEIEVDGTVYADNSIEIADQTNIACGVIGSNITELGSAVTSYTATASDHIIQFTYAGPADLTVTLPSSSQKGHTLVVSKGDSNGNLTFIRTGSGSIDGSISWGSFTTAYESLTLVALTTTGVYYFIGRN